MSNAAVTLVDAARALGVSVATLRRDLAAGAPVVRRGGRGRGRTALVSVEAIAAWRRSRHEVARPDDRFIVLAAELPELLASVIYDAFCDVDGAHKRDCAGALAACWYVITVAVLDRIRIEAPAAPDVETLPTKIALLRAIFDRHGTVSPIDNTRE